MDVAKDVAVTNSQDDSLVLPFDGAPSSLPKDSVLQDPFNSVQNGGHFNESSLSPLVSSETFKMMADQGQNGSHSGLQSKTPALSLEHLKAGKASSLSVQREEGNHLACHGETPETSSEELHPAETSGQITEGEAGKPHTKDATCPAATAGSLKHWEAMDTPSEFGQEERGSPFVPDGDPSGFLSEQQKSDCSILIQLGRGEENQMNWHGQSPGEASELPEQWEASRGPKEIVCSVENSQEHAMPKSTNPLLQGVNSPRQPREGSSCVSLDHPSNWVSSAEPQGTLDPANICEGSKEMTGTGGRGKGHGGQDQQPVDPGNCVGDLNRLFLEETPVDNSQTSEELVAQDHEHTAVSPSQALALTDPQSDVGICCQQRAAGTGCDTFPKAMPLLSPVATSDSLGPASGGLAPGCDEQGREGLSAPKSCAAGSNSTSLGEAGAKAILESERGEETARDTGPEHTTRESGRAQAPAGAKILDSLESVIDTSPEDPSDAMVLACTEVSLDTRDKEDSQDLSSAQDLVPTSEQAGSGAKPRAILLSPSKEPANTEVLGDTTGPICATPISNELSVAGGPHCPMDWMENDTGDPENRCPITETPIEREIRLHLKREELLRQERGLTNPRSTQQYVEVRIRPILNQSVPPSPLPQEKERQWAGAQMQREIQRECQREEDLVQLGKVRGAYDRGIQQELQEKKMIFEQHSTTDPLTPTKMVPSSPEANGVTNSALLVSGALRQPQQPLLEMPPTAHPYFCLRAKGPQSLLEREVQEAQEREKELQRQRHKLYGSALFQQSEEASSQDKEVPFQPERPPCKKLDVTWPPPNPSETCQVNGLHQLERSLRSRQKSALILRWESGMVGNQESQD